MKPTEFVSASDGPAQRLGAVHYFHNVTREVADELGLDLFRFYFCGRGGVLGDVDSSVVQSAFGYFNPQLLHKMWTTGGERCPVTEAAAAQMSVAYRIGEEALGALSGLGEAADHLARITSEVDASALALFAGFRSLPVPSSDPARFMHQVVLLRELRGSVHLAALAATGCPTREAHQLKRPGDGEMFGWTDAIEVSEADRDAFARANELTDLAMEHHVAVLSDEERSLVLAALEQAEQQLSS